MNSRFRHCLTLVRWLVGVALGGLAFHRLANLDAGGPEAGVVCLFTFSSIILAALLVAPEAVLWVSRPMLAWIDGIYGGREHAKRPPLDYRLAEFYERNARWDDLAENLERIHGFYPSELRPYTGVLKIYSTAGSATASPQVRRRLSRLMLKSRLYLSTAECQELKTLARELDAGGEFPSEFVLL